jgi:signal recognition particle subunit SRP72
LEALQAQCFALAQSDQYSALLDLLGSATLLPRDQVIFQKAYCLYRLSRHNEALKLIASVQNPSTNLKHLEAQAVRHMLSFQSIPSMFFILKVYCLKAYH